MRWTLIILMASVGCASGPNPQRQMKNMGVDNQETNDSTGEKAPGATDSRSGTDVVIDAPGNEDAGNTQPPPSEEGGTSAPKPEPKPAPEPEADPEVSLGDKLIESGKKYLGTPYKFGAEYETSGHFDTSSFTQYVFNIHGITLPRITRDQSTVGESVQRINLQIGDLVFFSTEERIAQYPEGSIDRIGKVGIYAGNGEMLFVDEIDGVGFTTITSGLWDEHYITARRVSK